MITAIVLSGGTGTRLGMDIPKQYIKVNGRSVLLYACEALLKHEKIDQLVIVANRSYWDDIEEEIKKIDCNNKFIGATFPGATRQLSILNGMLYAKEKIGSTPDYVFVHDAARPFLSEKMITECVEAVESHDGVLPVLPMKDTVYLSTDGGKSVTSLLDRSQIFAGQAPEMFSFDKYMDANMRLIVGELTVNKDVLEPDKTSPIYKINGSTEPAIMAGMDIAMIPGDENNYKITTMSDLERFKADLGI